MNASAKWLLGFDASTSRCVIALGRVGVDRAELVHADIEEDRANQASARLVPRLGEVLDRAGVATKELAAIGCGRGPGTFTGTRVAIATAKGLAVGLGVPVVPVSTLTALALGAGVTGPVLALLDARRGEVYGVLLDCEPGGETPRVEARTVERVAPAADVVADVRAVLGDRPATLIGPGVEPYRDAFPADWPALPCPGPSSEGLWRAVLAGWVAGEAADPDTVDAVYLRKSYAELGINRPKRPFVKSPFV